MGEEEDPQPLYIEVFFVGEPASCTGKVPCRELVSLKPPAAPKNCAQGKTSPGWGCPHPILLEAQLGGDL